MSDSFYYEDSKCPKCPRKDGARLADQTLGVSHVKDVTRFWKRGTRSWGPPPIGSLSLGLFQSFSETWNRNADDSFPFETDDDIIVQNSAVGTRDYASEGEVENVSCVITETNFIANNSSGSTILIRILVGTDLPTVVLSAEYFMKSSASNTIFVSLSTTELLRRSNETLTFSIS